MSDDKRVIAETADYELLDDGCLLVKYEGARNVELRDFPLLLADLARRRVRKELGQYRLEQIVELTDRIEAVEKAIQDTRVDQGEMGLVTECQEKNILRKIEGMADRVTAVERNVASHEQEIGMTNEDVAMYGARLRVLEARQQDVSSGVRGCTCGRLDVHFECGAEPARQQGEAGEGAHATDEEILSYMEQGREQGRRELAREIADFIRRKTEGESYPPGLRVFGSLLADDVEREFLGGE